jgi:hypothetical protein
MYVLLVGVAMWDSELEKMAAVAESAATTRWRGAEDCKRNERQQHGVETGDDGRAGDAGIAKNLRNVHRRERHARQGIASRLAISRNHFDRSQLPPSKFAGGVLCAHMHSL